MNNAYKLQKVFNCVNMPQDILEDFYDIFDGTSNDVYVSHYIGEKIEDIEYQQKYQAIDHWLITNGAQDKEEVIIYHTW